MSLLILALPPGLPGPAPSYAWATSVDGRRPSDHGEAAAALLPPAGRGVEVVAVAPAACLSWHRVALPRGIGPRSPRLRATLAGLLEEQLLDEPEQLHFALAPDVTAGSTAWVAVCRRDWLAAHLQALDAAQRPVARIVPELAPGAGAPQLIVTGEPEHPQLLLAGASAQALPLHAGTRALLQASAGDDWVQAPVQAEPAVAALAESWLGQAPQLISPAERRLQACASAWDLAQGELARSGAARRSRRLGAAWRSFWHTPAWRPARWGLGLLLAVQLVGLNLSAWHTRTELAQRRAQIDAALTQAFPQVKVVVDAPVQMARELAALRQSTGATSPRDLGPMLSAWAQQADADAGAVPTAFEYAPGELRVKGVQLAASTLTQARAQLRPLGYRLDTEGDAAVLREDAGP